MSRARPMVAWHGSAPVLAFALVALFAACSTDGPADSGTETPGTAEVLFSDSPPAWFEAYFTALDVAPDGQTALFDGGRLLDLRAGREVALESGLDATFIGTFDGDGTPVVQGRRGEVTAWFRIGADGAAATPASVPQGMQPIWSSSGGRVAYIGPPGPDGPRILIRPADASSEPTSYAVPGVPSAAEWAGGDERLLFLVPAGAGLGTLYDLDPETGESRPIARDLDGPWRGAQIAVHDDGSAAFLALASDGAPDPEARHAPGADRDLDIYEVDLATGDLSPIVRTPAEELAPSFAGGVLYWVSIETRSEAVIVPAEGGEARLVAEDVQGPTWRPDGRAIGVTTGDWRRADWALNLDGGVIEIDADGRPMGPIEPIITGYHEDFSPAWSPDGRWIAYHSHRSSAPVSGYASEGSTDDIFVRRPDARTSEEIRLTDFGWEVGTPDWAPDGRRLLIDSWDRDGADGERDASTWIVEMDPETGTLAGRTRVPAPAEASGIPTWGAWSPTRDEIAQTYAVPSSNEGEIWVMAPDGSSARRVVTFEGNRYGGVDWTTDGDAIVYSALVDGRQQLFSVARTGGEPRQLSDDTANLFHPRVSPDGRWIAATRIEHTRRVLRQPR